MGAPEIEAFLTHLAVNIRVTASTQNQALSALLFLYRHVLHVDIDLEIDAVRAKRSRYLPTVLSYEKAIAILDRMYGEYQLVAKLLYAITKSGFSNVVAKDGGLNNVQNLVIV